MSDLSNEHAHNEVVVAKFLYTTALRQHRMRDVQLIGPYYLAYLVGFHKTQIEKYLVSEVFRRSFSFSEVFRSRF